MCYFVISIVIYIHLFVHWHMTAKHLFSSSQDVNHFKVCWTFLKRADKNLVKFCLHLNSWIPKQ